MIERIADTTLFFYLAIGAIPSQIFCLNLFELFIWHINTSGMKPIFAAITLHHASRGRGAIGATCQTPETFLTFWQFWRLAFNQFINRRNRIVKSSLFGCIPFCGMRKWFLFGFSSPFIWSFIWWGGRFERRSCVVWLCCVDFFENEFERIWFLLRDTK